MHFHRLARRLCRGNINLFQSNCKKMNVDDDSARKRSVRVASHLIAFIHKFICLLLSKGGNNLLLTIARGKRNASGHVYHILWLYTLIRRISNLIFSSNHLVLNMQNMNNFAASTLHNDIKLKPVIMHTHQAPPFVLPLSSHSFNRL